MMNIAAAIRLSTQMQRAMDASTRDSKPIYALLAHVMSELGEFAEAVEHHQGHLPYKTMKEPVEGEAADVIQCVCAILRRIYPDSTTEQLVDMIAMQMEKKTTKWIEVMTERTSDPDA